MSITSLKVEFEVPQFVPMPMAPYEDLEAIVLKTHDIKLKGRSRTTRTLVRSNEEQHVIQ